MVASETRVEVDGEVVGAAAVGAAVAVDPFSTRPGRTFRILAINDTSHDCHAVWTVELE